MAFAARTCSPEVVDTCGGNIVTITGTFSRTNTYVVRAAVGADATALESLAPCYSATQGQGHFCTSTNGTSICFASPASAPGALQVRITEVSTGQATVLGPLDVQPPLISSLTFTLRTSLPLNYATGPRSVAALPEPNAAAKVDI